MRRGFLIILSMVALLIFTSRVTQAEEQLPMQQTYTTPEAKIGDKVVCPVMKTPITVNEKTPSVKIKDKNYYVCCSGCIEKLNANPDKYLTPKEVTPAK